MTPNPLSGTLLGGRTRAKRVYTERDQRPPRDHRFCSIHPERYIRGSMYSAPEPCWLCELEGSSPLMDKAAFHELDRLIALHIEVPQERITEEMIAQAEARKSGV